MGAVPALAPTALAMFGTPAYYTWTDFLDSGQNRTQAKLDAAIEEIKRQAKNAEKAFKEQAARVGNKAVDIGDRFNDILGSFGFGGGGGGISLGGVNTAAGELATSGQNLVYIAAVVAGVYIVFQFVDI